MEKRDFLNGNESVSLLGFGCMRLPVIGGKADNIDCDAAKAMLEYAISHGVNYFDTAYPYHGGKSESFVGQALAEHPRDSYYLASKLPLWDLKTKDDAERIFDEQLARCRVEYFDFYLAHNINIPNYRLFQDLSVHDFLVRKKKEGRIRHIGFSFHEKPNLMEAILANHDWDFAQIQLNYLDWELQEAGLLYEMLTEAGLPVAVMEPLRGGTLAKLSKKAVEILSAADSAASPASWALRYAGTLLNVFTVLSGMSTLAQVEDNVGVFFAVQTAGRERTFGD